MTNADKIRSMSDEELAEFIGNNDDCECCAFGFGDDDCNKIACKIGVTLWLKKEADE